MYAGVEAGGTTFVVAVGTGPDDQHAAPPIPTAAPAETLARAVAAIRDLAGDRPLRAVGLASFGPLELDRDASRYGQLVATPKPGWSGTDMVTPFRAAFDVPVGLDTDVNAAALAETRWGAARGLDPVVYVTVGTGIGGGAVVGGRLLHGLVHPEMGHQPVRRHPDDGYEGGCPYHGDCLEGLAAGPALQARFGRPGAELDGAERERAVEFEAFYLAQLVVAVTGVLSPRRVLLGGGVLGLPGLLDAVRARTARLLGGYPAHPLLGEHVDEYVVRPGLGDRAGVLGAIALAEVAAGGA